MLRGSPDDTVGEREIDRETERVHKKGVITDVQLYSPRADFFVRMPFASPVQKKMFGFSFLKKKIHCFNACFFAAFKDGKKRKIQNLVVQKSSVFFLFFFQVLLLLSYLKRSTAMGGKN